MLFSVADLINMERMEEFLAEDPKNIVLCDRGFVSHIAYYAAKDYPSSVIQEVHEKLFRAYARIANILMPPAGTEIGIVTSLSYLFGVRQIKGAQRYDLRAALQRPYLADPASGYPLPDSLRPHRSHSLIFPVNIVVSIHRCKQVAWMWLICR
jgi:hypothetical protein